MSRTRNAIRNSLVSGFFSIAVIVVSLIAQKIFVEQLNVEYLGLNGLFTNIISVLSIVELGLGSAIIYHLYKPLHKKNYKKVADIIQFYKVGYRLIAAIVTVLSLSFLPFLPMIVGEIAIPINVYIVFALFVAEVVFSYLMVYKRSILFAAQDNHLVSSIHLAYIILMNIAQVWTLLATGNYYLYLVMRILARVVENLALTYFANKRYPYINQPTRPLDKKTKKDIYQKIRGLLYHKVADAAINGTDNIVIASFFGVISVGIYNSYFLLSQAINVIIGRVFADASSSVGNLLASTTDIKKHKEIFEKILFVNFFLSSIAATGFLVVATPFIHIWLGSKYELSVRIVVVLAINLYFFLVRGAANSFKTAAGIFHQDRFMPIIETLINLVFSIVLAYCMGLAGVFIATILSNLFLHLYSYPRYVYGPLLGEGWWVSFWRFMRLTAISGIAGALTFWAADIIVVNDALSSVFLDGTLAVIIPSAVIILACWYRPEFRYFVSMAKRMIVPKK